MSFENIFMIKEWADTRNYSLNSTKFFEENFKLPNHEDYDMLIVMGGAMSVHDEDEHEWLKHEKEFIKEAIIQKKLVLGICLGSQLIAQILSAEVSKNKHKEIGWFNVEFFNQDHPSIEKLLTNIDSQITTFHWHGDRFEIPKEAIIFAKSEACENQAFLYKNHVMGLQFHLEMNEVALKEIISGCKDDIESNLMQKYVEKPEIILSSAEKKVKQTKEILFKLLDNWLLLRVNE